MNANIFSCIPLADYDTIKEKILVTESDGATSIGILSIAFIGK